MVRDIRDEIFRGVADDRASATVSVEADGVLSGLEVARRHAEAAGLSVTARAADGSLVRWGDVVLLVQGSPKAIAQGEEVLIGAMAKASGIATAAAEAVRRASDRVEIVSGGWKKMPLELKAVVRDAVRAGGVRARITDDPFVYLDKNYVRLLGGIRQALDAAAHLPGHVRVIQVRGEHRAIADEAAEAAAAGAGVLMVDTGNPDDLALVAERLRALGRRDQVRIAFAGNVALADIGALSALDADILDVGGAIVDAPMLPMRFDVIPRSRAGAIELNLLEKTELWVRPIQLDGANLQDIGQAVAEVLEFAPDEVLVTDVRDDLLALDILRRTVIADQIAGRERALLSRLASIAGVTVSGETGVHSEGILGLIALDEADVAPMLESGRNLGERIRQAIARRAIVFPTGKELQQGAVRDTNSELVASALRRRGFRCAVGPVLPDDAETIAGAIRRATGEGYGLVITTGGLGAEDKDQTAEGILKVDPSAATPYLAHFHPGTGRHVKDGVRIAVGQLESSLIVAMPGPNEEVRVGLEVLLEGLQEGLGKADLAQRLAARLRETLRRKMAGHNPP